VHHNSYGKRSITLRYVHKSVEIERFAWIGDEVAGKSRILSESLLYFNDTTAVISIGQMGDG
jgi:hypothetical protein